MSTPTWAPGTLYQPGAIVTPRSNAVVTQVQPSNNSFESGLTHWTATITNGTGTVLSSSSQAFDGAESALFTATSGTGQRNSALVKLANSYMAPVKAGQVINFSGYCFRSWSVPNTAFVGGGVRIDWYTSGMAFISSSLATSPPQQGSNDPPGMIGARQDNVWIKSSGQGIAPANAAFANAVFTGWVDSNGGSQLYFDYFVWDYTEQGYPPGLVFVATQANPGISGATEPVWPVNPGQTVQDGGVTWTGEDASLIIWTANSILKSGAVQPTFPTSVGGTVVDNAGSQGIIWTATDGRITDTNCPNSKIVAAGAAKVFAANGDIINFCATANPQDWTTSQDAGYIPFGMNSYGNEDVAALNIYRSNLVAFNSLGYQMWQIDPDPANMDILDGEPVGCLYNKSVQPLNNDLVFLSPIGVRNIGTAGASGNLQAGMFGKQIDPLIKAAVAALPITGYEPKSLYYSGAGQYWLFFGPQAFVLTINGTTAMSWSRYTFPDIITDWTMLNGSLYIRAGDLVWQVNELTGVDDLQTGGGSIALQCYMAWEYVDFGAIGIDKQMEGFDLVMKGSASIQFGYSQSDRSLATDWFEMTDADTVGQGSMVPLPLVGPSFQARILFDAGQIAPIQGDALSEAGYPIAEWSVLNVYVTPLVKQ